MSHNAPISHQLSPAPCWAAMSAASWPAANPSGDNVDLEVFGTEDEFVDVDQFFAEPPSAEWGVVNPSVVRSPLTIFNPSIAQPAPAVTEPSMAACPIMECEALQQDATRALCNEHTQFAAWNGGVAKAPTALHPRLARGGGNLAKSKESGKVFYVPMNKDEVLLYQPKASYERDIETLKQYIDALPSEAKKLGGVEQPLLHVREVRIPMAVSSVIEQKIYGHRKGNKAFGSLLCNLGMRSSIDKKANVRTLKFDPDGWNRTGYRLIKGGDVKGGKPTIVPVIVPV